MILLTSTADLIRVTTSSSGSVKVHASYVDTAAPTTFTPGRTNTAAITTATTTTVVSPPGVGLQRTLGSLAIRNDHASTANVVTIEHFDGTTASVLWKGTLLPSESVTYEQGRGWAKFDSTGIGFTSAGATSTTSGVPAGGSTGQVLAKQSNADGDAGWVAGLSPSANINFTGAVDFTPAPTFNGVSAGGSDLVLGTRFFVPGTTYSGLYIATKQNGWAVPPTGQQSFVPFKLNRSISCKIGVYVVTAGAAGSTVNAGVWNTRLVGGVDVPGTLVRRCTLAAGTGFGPFGGGKLQDSTTINLAANTTYWMAVDRTGSPSAVGSLLAWQLTENLPGPSGYGNNEPYAVESWRYSTVQTGDISTSPATGDFGQTVCGIHFVVA